MFSLRGKLLIYALEIVAVVLLLLSIPPSGTALQIGFAGLAFFAVALAFLLGRSVALRLEDLVEAARAIGGGRYDIPVAVGGRDEIGVVAAELDRMRLTLREKVGQLETLNRELEKKVEERTELLTRANRRLAVLNEVINAVNSSLDFQTIFEAVVSGTRRLVDFDQASVARAVDADTAVVYAITGGFAALRRGEAFVLEGSRIGEVLQTRKPAVYDVPFPPRREDSLLMSSIIREVILPLVAGDQPIGTLNFGSARKDAFGPDDVAVLIPIAREVAVALLQADAFERERLAAEELKRLSDLKSEFVSKVSHELRTPLTSIVGAADNLLDGIVGPLEEKPRAYVGRIRENSERLLRLINELLDLARIEAGREELVPVRFSLDRLIEESCETMRPVGAKSGVGIELTSTEPMEVVADRDKISRVLLNLLHNAIRFTGRGGRVAVRALRNAGGTIRVEVSDSGIGIPTEELERVFDKFHQVNRGSAMPVSGTGLGLPISRQLVELHGGRLSVESAPDRGSTFTIELPAASASLPS